mmetsp:Transcript_70489/g.177735  ORF Transcript_70489/g.177735 Transcript_70489/m.177735 type:complete len:262 (-) Transcript_70489:358-1143(-)
MSCTLSLSVRFGSFLAAALKELNSALSRAACRLSVALASMIASGASSSNFKSRVVQSSPSSAAVAVCDFVGEATASPSNISSRPSAAFSLAVSTDPLSLVCCSKLQGKPSMLCRVVAELTAPHAITISRYFCLATSLLTPFTANDSFHSWDSCAPVEFHASLGGSSVKSPRVACLEGASNFMSCNLSLSVPLGSVVVIAFAESKSALSRAACGLSVALTSMTASGTSSNFEPRVVQSSPSCPASTACDRGEAVAACSAILS